MSPIPDFVFDGKPWYLLMKSADNLTWFVARVDGPPPAKALVLSEHKGADAESAAKREITELRAANRTGVPR